MLAAAGRRTDAWDHTAALLAMLANVNRDPKTSRAFTPADFHPLRKRQQRPPDAVVSAKELKSLLGLGGKHGGNR